MKKNAAALPEEGTYVVNLSNNNYIHIKDKNTNTTRYFKSH